MPVSEREDLKAAFCDGVGMGTEGAGAYARPVEGFAGMRITISRLINGISINGEEYALGADGKALAFGTVKEAINFFANHNYAIDDLRELDWHFEETE
jgi:hypothetical protein